MITFQCSPYTTSQGIIKTFEQCATLQHESNVVAVVVLEEIGLAEDSPNMPLKVLEKIRSP
jgi:hypothetical protein